MRASPLENRIATLAAPVIEDLGFALVHVAVIGEGGGRNVQIMAEDPATKRLGIDDCTKISKALSAALDVEDPIDGKYRLEVSSPGIDRPLVCLEDFNTYKGLEVKVETFVPTEEGQKRFRGRIMGVQDGETVLLNTDRGEVEIPFSAMAKAKLVLTDELIKTTANKG